MRVTLESVDVQACRHEGADLCLMIPRGAPASRWAVMVAGETPAAAPRFNLVLTGELVYVPVVAYLVSPDPATVVGFATQLGLQALASCPEPAAEALVAFGNIVEPVGDPAAPTALRVFLGIALRLGATPR